MKNIWTQVRNTLKKKHIPFEMVLELTKRCNLNCCHCYNVKDNADLTFEQIREISAQLREAGCLFLVLTGGEVFVKPDFLEIASYLRTAGFDLKIFSNGTLINSETVKVLKDIALSEIGISILGAQAITHDSITGVKGSFDKAVNTVRMLKKAGISVNIKCTLMQQNYHEHKEIINLAKELGVTYMMDAIISPKDDGSTDILRHRLRDDQLEDFYTQEAVGLENIEKEEDAFACGAGDTFGSISSTGDVYPCIQLPLALGNVFEQRFKYIWESSGALRRMRTMTQDEIKTCKNCRIASLCTRCPGLAFLENNDMFGASSTACLNAHIHKKIGQNR